MHRVSFKVNDNKRICSLMIKGGWAGGNENTFLQLGEQQEPRAKNKYVCVREFRTMDHCSGCTFYSQLEGRQRIAAVVLLPYSSSEMGSILISNAVCGMYTFCLEEKYMFPLFSCANDVWVGRVNGHQ